MRGGAVDSVPAAGRSTPNMKPSLPGTPNWVDLGTPDLDVTKRFYGELFGWTAHVSPEPEVRGYTIFNKDGQPVAGTGPLFSDDQLPAWSTYVATDDAD